MFTNFTGTREELLDRVAVSANSSQIGVESVILNLDEYTQKKYKINSDEFITVYPEHIRSLVMSMFWTEVPKYNANVPEIETRNQYIKSVSDKVIKILTETGEDEEGYGLQYLISYDCFKSWEELDSFVARIKSDIPNNMTNILMQIPETSVDEELQKVKSDKELNELGYTCYKKLCEFSGFENINERLWVWDKVDKETKVITLLVTHDLGNTECVVISKKIINNFK